MRFATWSLAMGLAAVGPAVGINAAAPSVYAASLSQVTTQSLAAVHPAMQQQLAYGSQGHWVMTLQADLELLGYSQVGPIDGVFGPKTESGLEAFQAAQHLPVTGVADPVTWQDILSGFGLVPAYVPSSTSAAAIAATTSPSTIDGRPIIATYHMLATAYGPSLQDNYPYGPVDAFGQPLQPGMIAVDPSVIPLKSTVYVQGYQDQSLPSGGFVGHAMDTGGAIQGQRIDIYMNASPGVVSNFGIQPVTVYVLGQ